MDLRQKNPANNNKTFNQFCFLFAVSHAEKGHLGIHVYENQHEAHFQNRLVPQFIM